MSNRLRFRFRNTVGGGGASSPAPVNTVAPAVTGNAYVGSTLTCSTGTWTFNPFSFSYQWKADAGNVGTNQNTYVPVTGDIGKVITCVVTATNIAGSTPATSNATAAVIGAPVNTVIPAISGTAQVGSTLTSTTGTWTGGGSITYAYQWKSAGSNVGTNQNTYVPVIGDVGNTITVTVTATNAAGSGTPAVSNATSAVLAGFTVWGAGTNIVLSNSDLTVAASGGSGLSRSAAQKNASKFYFEILVVHWSDSGEGVGVATAAATITDISVTGTKFSGVYRGGNIWSNSASSGVSLTNPISDGATLDFAIDLDNELIWIRRDNGNWNANGAANPATGANGISMSDWSATTVSPTVAFVSGSSMTANFGSSAFARTAPSGFAGWTV